MGKTPVLGAGIFRESEKNRVFLLKKDTISNKESGGFGLGSPSFVTIFLSERVDAPQRQQTRSYCRVGYQNWSGSLTIPLFSPVT
jgi:hypothetical protein